ncbi:MAG: DNA replication/repair protein RecF [Pseudomonadota bacterium]
MALSRLDVNNLRNLRTTRLLPGPQFNLFWGANGAGKTSVLEAVHLLGRGCSFRTSDFRHLLPPGVETCVVTGKLVGSGMALSTEFNRNGVNYRIDGNLAPNRAALSERLPVIFLGPDSHRLLSDGPQLRRRFMDWGVFHVEPQFLTVWRRYQRALKQRNMALRVGQGLDSWDNELVRSAQEITRFRTIYLSRLLPHVEHYLAELCELEAISLALAPGWRADADYSDVLRVGQEQDRAFGYTRYGAHRADLIIKTAGKPAKDVVSRGQQKLLICALMLAQATVVNTCNSNPSVLLVDDFASELDPQHRFKLLQLLAELRGQVFMTATERLILPQEFNTELAVFHVEHGEIKQQA